MEKKYLREMPEESGEKDRLTQLYKRRRLHALVDEYLSAEKTTQDSHAVLFYIDLNHFKEINDRFGYLLGDEVLKVTADKLRSSSMPEAFLGRVGGDEFIVFFRRLESDADSVKQLEDQIRSAVYHGGQSVNPDIRLTCRIGSAFYSGEGTDFLALAEQAGKEMY